MGDAELIKNIRVPARDVGNHEVRTIQAVPDVNENVGGGKHIVSTHGLDGQGLARAGQGAVDIARPLKAKGHDDETANLALSARQFWRRDKGARAPEREHLSLAGPPIRGANPNTRRGRLIAA